jgi:Uma2 family endonuclease
MSTQPLPFITPEQYLEAERKAMFRSQYLNGEVFAMSGGSRQHVRIVSSITTMLNNQLEDSDCEVYPIDLRLRVNPGGDYLYTYPDLSIACGEPQFEDDHFDTLLNPRVLIEVLSPSTSKFDRGEKFRLYSQITSLAEYLLIAQDRVHVERRARQADGTWQQSEWASLEDVVELPSVGAKLELSRVYRRVTFDQRA